MPSAACSIAMTIVVAASLVVVGACGLIQPEEDWGAAGLGLSSSSFFFQHPLIGASYSRTCNFDTTTCYLAGKYHTGTDDSTTGHPPVRAASFGQRVLVQVNGQGDHGLGNVVGLKFLLADGTWIYSTSNHLRSIHPLSARPDGSIQAPRGAKLGEIGNSGFGDPNHWKGKPHLHLEFKTAAILSNPCGALKHYGYTPSSATNYCYQDPDAFIGNRRVLMPEFSTSDGGWGDHDVLYGVADTPLFARVALEGAPSSYASLGVGGRAGWSGTVMDFPMISSPAGDSAHVASRSFQAGDYRFFGAVLTTTGEWRTGYPVIFTVVDGPSDFIRDNDMPSPYFSSGSLGVSRFDGYGYGAAAATGASDAWARWQAKPGTYALYAYVGGNGVGSVRFKVYPEAGGAPVYTDSVELGGADYGWVQLRAGTQTSWTFEPSGYVGLSAESGSASDVVLFDAIKFVAR